MTKQHTEIATQAPRQDVVLVVDDNPNGVSLLVDVLGRAGFKVLVAEDGAAGLEVAVEADPDVVLLDVMMPNLDGYATCRALKANQRTAQIPVIFMTSLDDNVERVQAFAAGGVDYVTKPFRAEEVLARVNAHATIRRLRRELEAVRAELALK